MPASNFYQAPLHVKANGGVFLIDDFGRQLCSPKELLNRWILPLEDRHDFLTVASGKKFEVPFEQLIIFSTNLDPQGPGRRRLPAPHPAQGLHRCAATRDLRAYFGRRRQAFGASMLAQKPWITYTNATTTRDARHVPAIVEIYWRLCKPFADFVEYLSS